LSKHETWFNHIAAPNSGFEEFEPNFAEIMGSRLVGCHLPPRITGAMAKAPVNVLWIKEGVIMTGAVLLLPTLAYLLNAETGTRVLSSTWRSGRRQRSPELQKGQPRGRRVCGVRASRQVRL